MAVWHGDANCIGTRKMTEGVESTVFRTTGLVRCFSIFVHIAFCKIFNLVVQYRAAGS
jgi:hypothetical protein